MFCPSCGGANEPSTRFCIHCGQSLAPGSPPRDEVATWTEPTRSPPSEHWTPPPQWAPPPNNEPPPPPLWGAPRPGGEAPAWSNFGPPSAEPPAPATTRLPQLISVIVMIIIVALVILKFAVVARFFGLNAPPCTPPRPLAAAVQLEPRKGGHAITCFASPSPPCRA